MKNNKNRPSAATPGRTEETGTVPRTGHQLHLDSTITHRETQEGAIADLLLPGQQNAVSLRHLVSITGLSERAVRLKIAFERKHGALILSDNHSGYYLPDSPDDLRRFARSMAHRAGEIAAVARLAEAAVAEAEGQETIAGW